MVVEDATETGRAAGSTLAADVALPFSSSSESSSQPTSSSASAAEAAGF